MEKQTRLKKFNGLPHSLSGLDYTYDAEVEGGEVSYTPRNSKNEFILNHQGLKVATGDSFVTENDSWLNQQNVDLVDMELFAIAKVSNKLGVQCMAIKYGSDLANSNASMDWKKSLDRAKFLLNEKIRDSLNLAGKNLSH